MISNYGFKSVGSAKGSTFIYALMNGIADKFSVSRFYYFIAQSSALNCSRHNSIAASCDKLFCKLGCLRCIELRRTDEKYSFVRVWLKENLRNICTFLFPERRIIGKLFNEMLIAVIIGVDSA